MLRRQPGARVGEAPGLFHRHPAAELQVDPELFPALAELQTIGHKLIPPPGSNNPVGVAWIGLGRPGYGIHGTPVP